MKKAAIAFLTLAIIFSLGGCGSKEPEPSLPVEESEMVFAEFDWPDTDIAKLMPVAKSNVGYLDWSKDYGFVLYVAETSASDFADYMKACEDRGFTEDCRKGDDYFYANNVDGYHVSLNLRDENVMFVRIDAPKEQSSESTQEPELDISPSTEPTDEPSTTPSEEPPTSPSDETPAEQASESQEPTTESEGQGVIYSSNTFEKAKNGNSGVFAYRHDDKNYDIYWIIDFDEGFAYTFTLGNGNEICDKIEITSGDLNNYILITYHDGGDSWEEGLRFKRKRQPDRMVWMDGKGTEVEFIGTSLEEALSLRDGMTVVEY